MKRITTITAALAIGLGTFGAATSAEASLPTGGCKTFQTGSYGDGSTYTQCSFTWGTKYYSGGSHHPPA